MEKGKHIMQIKLLYMKEVLRMVKDTEMENCTIL